MPAPTSERSVPCGVCQGQVPESHFRSGRARMYQEVLYCATCTSEAEKARVETAAFKQSLTKGFYACSKCESPMAMKDIETNNVVFFQGNLYCRDCSKDLRGILRPGGGSVRLRNSAVFNSQASGAGINAQSSPSRRLAPSNVSNISGIGTVSGRIAAQTQVQGPPCHLCDKPAVAVAGQPLPLEYQGNIYCGACRREIDHMIARSQEDLARISTFECQRCRATVRARDVIEGRAIRYRGQILCATCSKDVGGRGAANASAQAQAQAQAGGTSSLEVPADESSLVVPVAKKPIPVAPPPTAPCARCERMIPGLDIRLGKALERDGKLFCARCKVELEQARELRNRKAAKAISCSHCGRAISAKEIQEKKITYHEGNVYCFGCGKDPAKILLGHSSDEQAVGKCRMCGAATQPGARGNCAACQAKVDRLQQDSLAKSGELARASGLSYPCDGEGCQNPITEEDLEAGRAVIQGDKSLCPSCAAKLKPKKAPARCARCRKALEPGAAPGSFCAACAEKSADDAADMEAALKLSSEFMLRCAVCQRAVQAEELENGKAVTIQGKLTCSNCRFKQPAKAATPAAAMKKLCATCDGALSGAGVPYGDKRICPTCQGLLENLLAASQMPATQTGTCKACKKPAKGEGALLVEGQPFCKACRRAADFLILYTIRAKRTSRSRAGSASRAPILIAGASAVAIFAVAWSIFSGRDRTKEIKVDPPQITKGKKEDEKVVVLDPVARGEQLVRSGAQTYEQAQELVVKLTKLQEESKEPKLAELLAKAIALRNGYAYAIATKIIAAAEASVRREKYDEALKTLDRFPAELLETDSGRDVAKLREKIQAIVTCIREANGYLAGGPPERYQAMFRLLESPGAKLCGFPDTALGKELAAKAQVLKNDYLAAHPETPTAPNRLSPDDLVARARDQEGKSSFGNADSFYTQALQADPDKVEAMIGVARMALEFDRPRRGAPHVDRLRRIAKTNPEVRVLDGWYALVMGDADGYDRAKAAIAGLKDKELGPRGRALQAILELGAPSVRGPRSQLVGELDRLALSAADDALEAACEVLAVPRGDDRMLILAFKSDGARSAFVQKLGRALNEDGRLPGCCAVAVVAPQPLALARTVVTALAARADSPQGWVVAAIPQVAAHEVVPAPPGGDPKLAPLADLEAASASAVIASPVLLHGAYKRVASALENGKASVLATYVANRREKEKRAAASKELESSLAPLLR